MIPVTLNAMIHVCPKSIKSTFTTIFYTKSNVVAPGRRRINNDRQTAHLESPDDEEMFLVFK